MKEAYANPTALAIASVALPAGAVVAIVSLIGVAYAAHTIFANKDISDEDFDKIKEKLDKHLEALSKWLDESEAWLEKVKKKDNVDIIDELDRKREDRAAEEATVVEETRPVEEQKKLPNKVDQAQQHADVIDKPKQKTQDKTLTDVATNPHPDDPGFDPDEDDWKFKKKEWKIEKYDDVKYSDKYHAKYYRDPKAVSENGKRLWWSKDNAGHSGKATGQSPSRWKVYEDTSEGLKWYKDVDKWGQYISGKHKGPIGHTIKWKELRGVHDPKIIKIK